MYRGVDWENIPNVSIVLLEVTDMIRALSAMSIFRKSIPDDFNFVISKEKSKNTVHG